MKKKTGTDTVKRVLLIGLLAIPLCIVLYLAYFLWYTDTIPRAPVPAGARLLSRNPADSDHWSARARYWYYEKYSFPGPVDDAETFYAQAGYEALPFGQYYVRVLPPVPALGEEAPDLSEAPAVRRDSTDPADETIILIEVSWDPEPPPWSWLY